MAVTVKKLEKFFRSGLTKWLAAKKLTRSSQGFCPINDQWPPLISSAEAFKAKKLLEKIGKTETINNVTIRKTRWWPSYKQRQIQ